VLELSDRDDAASGSGGGRGGELPAQQGQHYVVGSRDLAGVRIASGVEQGRQMLLEAERAARAEPRGTADEDEFLATICTSCGPR